MSGINETSDTIVGGTDGTVIGNVGNALKVTGPVSVSGGSALTMSKKLRYDDMNAGSGGVAG